LNFGKLVPEPIPVRDVHGQLLFKIDQQSLRLDGAMAVALEVHNYLSLAFDREKCALETSRMSPRAARRFVSARFSFEATVEVRVDQKQSPVRALECVPTPFRTLECVPTARRTRP
jgi:hypothetical protein